MWNLIFETRTSKTSDQRAGPPVADFSSSISFSFCGGGKTAREHQRWFSKLDVTHDVFLHMELAAILTYTVWDATRRAHEVAAH